MPTYRLKIVIPRPDRGTQGFFLGLQADHDLMERRRQIEPELARIEPRAAVIKNDIIVLTSVL